MKSDKIQSLFATAHETYAPVEGQPSNPDLSTLPETLTALLLTIAYDGEKGVHNLVGLIMGEDAYKARHGANFPTPSSPEIYDVDIPIDASNAVRVRREASHTANKEDYRLFAATKSESSKFILAVVEDTWVPELRDPNLFYTAVKPRALLAHIQAMCVGLYDTDVINLQNKMQTYHEYMEGIPTYINNLEDAQKQSNQAGNPITLRTDRFPRANEIWEDLPGADQTWVRWKYIYRKSDMANKVKKASQGGQYHFGSHCAFDKVPDPEEPEAMPQLPVEEIDGYFSSLENAATTEKGILAALVKINATLTTSNASLTATVANLQQQLENLGKYPTPHR